MLNKKHNLKSGKSKDKKKGFQTENNTENPKKEKILQEKIAIEYFDVVLFMKQKQRRKGKKETKTRNKKKAKKKDKKKGKKKRTTERQRKRN